MYYSKAHKKVIDMRYKLPNEFIVYVIPQFNHGVTNIKVKYTAN